MEEHLQRLQMAADRGQLPRLRPAHTLGHRNMPQWVSRTFVHPSAVPPPPPPGPPGGQGRENDYEEIGPPARRQAAQHAMNVSRQQPQQQQHHQQQGRTGGGDGKERVHCDLCGSSASAVRCDKCSGQVFCLSCDDMYHRHPKRSAHVRKAVDSIQRPFRPPLPPKSDLQPPVPPPRRNKRFGLFGKKEQSPALPRKESASGVMGSLKRFMGVRPLPPPPTQKGGLTSVWEEPSVQPLPANLGRPQPSVQRSLSRGSADSGLPPSDTSAALPATVAAMNDAERHQRQTGQDQRDMDRNPVPVRPRSQSVTANMSSQQQQQLQQQQQQQAWMYPQDHHHHQHNDMLQGFVTTRRGQSYRAGWSGGMLAAGGSVCDVTSPPPGHHMAHPGFHHPHMMHSLAQLGCPTCHGHGPPVWYPNDPPDGHLHRFPSNSSLSAAHGGGGYPASPTVGGGGRFVSQRDIRQPSPAPSVRSGRAARPRRLARSQMELSRYPTDSDDPGSGVESDDESDQPPEETAPIPWACPHCTFQNSAGTRVCAMCCRTAPAVAAGQQRGAQRRRRRRRFPRGPLPPGSPAAPRRPRDPSPGSASHGGRERSDRSMSRGPSMGRELGRAPDTIQLTDDMQSLKMEAAGRDRRPSDAAAAAAAPRRVSVASVSAAESAAMSSAGVGTSDREASVPPPERESGGTGGQKRTQSTGTSPPPQTIATQTNEDPALYSEGSLPRTGSHRSLTGGYGEYEPLRYGGRQPRTLKRTQSFQAFGHQERQERADPWLSYGALGSRFQGRSSSKSSVHSAASDSRAFAAYGSGASSRGESPARFGSERGHSRHHSYAGETARKPADGSDYLVGLEEVMLNRSSDMTANQGMELVLMLRDAEKHNFSPEDLQIALNHCSERPPVSWLLDNLDSMIETVCTLATNYGHERPENDVGTISNREARDALRLHKGNVWSAVTECVEQRRKKYSQLAGRGSFSREDIITALTANHGSVEAAYLDLNRTQLKPFLMRIWGPPQGVEVNEGAPQGRPEVTPPPGGQTEVKANGKSQTAEAGSVVSQDNAKPAAELQTAQQKPEVSGDEVKVTTPVVTPEEVKVNSKVVSPPVLATAKADNEACKSKDYITPPTSPLLHRANQTAKPRPDSGLTGRTTSSPTSLSRPSESASVSGPDPAPVAPQPSSSTIPALSSALDVSPSSGVYETVAIRPAAAVKLATERDEDKTLREKPAGSQLQVGEKSPARSTETESQTVQPTPQNETQDFKNEAIPQVQPQTRMIPTPEAATAPMAARPKERTRSPVARAAVLSDRDSSEDYEPAVYGDFLVTRAAQGAAGTGSGQRSGVEGTEERRPAEGALPTGNAGRAVLVASPSQEKDQSASPVTSASLTKTSDVRTSQSQSPQNVSSKEESTQSAKYSIVKRPRPVTPLQDELPATDIAKPRDETASGTSENIAKTSDDKTPPPAATSSVAAAGAVPAAQTSVTVHTESVSRSAGEATPLGDSAREEPHERRSSDSSSTSSASTDVTEREQLPRKQTAGWVTSNLYASPVGSALNPAAAPATAKTDTSEAYDTPQPATAVPAAKRPSGRTGEVQGDGQTTEIAATASGSGERATSLAGRAAGSAETSSDAADTTYEVVSTAEARAASPMDPSTSPGVSRSSLSPSLSPPPGPVMASSRQNLSPSERLELAKRVICNHVQRQRPTSGASPVSGTSSEGRPGSTSPQPPPVHHGPAGPYTPASTAEIPDIEDGEDSADGAAAAPVHRPRTLRHVTGDLTPASESSGEEAGGATAGSHVVFTSSDSLSEGYEAVVSVRFQPGDGRGGGVRSATRSPMPAAPLVASSSAESLSRSDHQAAPQSRQQTAPPASRQVTPQAATATAGQEAAAEGVGTGAVANADAGRPLEPARAESTAAAGSAAERSSSGESVSSGPGQPSATTTGADSKPAPGQTSEASQDSDSSDSDSAEATAAARPSDVDVEALKEGLKNGRSNVLRRNSAERQKVQRRASRLLRSGRAQSQAEAEMASQLMALKFPADESLQAATQCSSLYAAVSFLHQECELCAGRCSAKELVAMTHCTHRCCVSCAQAYFTQRIKERPLSDLRCPFCNEPDLTSEEIASDYFSHLDIMLKTLVPPEIHSLFHKKLFERAMMKDPNFKWCPKCSSGFIAPARQQKLHCPDCRTVSCALCAKTWTGQHEGVSCEKFAMWQQHNDPDYQSAGLERHLADSGISCPSCRFRYSLAKGGCMHFTCSQCKYEFCSGCSQPFSMGSKCGKTELCSRLGLHAHHPRNCLFYLRDKEPKQLQQLLQNNGVEYNTDPPGGSDAYADVPRRCRVPEQKETASGLKDDLCGRTVFPDNAGLCRMHYIEYLCGLVWKHKLDPVSISDASDLRQELRRHGRRARVQRVREPDDKYTAALRRMVETELPLNV